ncbi:ubiquinone biosynthesis accessory factor UbiJ [Thiomicrorhabdus arctica]|uniref:ubiquinone biosynthesis accessory factor UbiJ n=1 Tax=Thiomicrorhabdus arctica TaxID=131540 RepID=UPI0003746448|nr:SCP2 sterol-binding domain-containing protein [Thiomicrorhabdus arctica]
MSKQPGLVNISLSKTIESVLNTAIRLDEEQGQAFKGLEDKVIKVTLTPVTSPVYFLFTSYMVSVQNQLTGEPDAALECTLFDFMSLPLNRTLPTSLMEGDTDLAMQFIDGLCGLDIDWEEHLSHYTGDLVAFKIGHGIRSFFEQKQTTKNNLGETVKEYLQFEINALPTQSQVKRFVQQVQQTQDEIDQLALRIEALLTKT